MAQSKTGDRNYRPHGRRDAGRFRIPALQVFSWQRRQLRHRGEFAFCGPVAVKGVVAQPTSEQDNDEINITNGARGFIFFGEIPTSSQPILTSADTIITANVKEPGLRKRSASPIELRPKKQRLLKTRQVPDSEKKDGALKVKDLFKVG